MEMKAGDVVRIKEVIAPAHPVGIVLKIVEAQGDQRRHMWCLYMDGDYEVLEYDTAFEVIHESGC
jgi:hypothetical protein